MPLNYHVMDADFHLLKRRNSKGKLIYYAAFLSDLPGKNGKKKYRAVKSTGVGSRSAAEKAARDMLVDGKVLSSRESLRDFLLGFWDLENSEYLKTQRADGRVHNSRYVRDSRSRIEQYVLPYFEHRGLTKLSDLDRRNIQAWRNHLFEHGRLPEYNPPEKDEKQSKRGRQKPPERISASTQNKVRAAFFAALQWAVDMEMLSHHPGQGVKRVREEKQERPIFELADLAKLFAKPWDDMRAYGACMLAATTGARMGEIRGLQIRNAHLDAGYLDIVTNYVDGDGLKGPKWGSDRIGVPLPTRTIEVLRAVIRLNPFRDEPEAFVFCSPSSVQRPVDYKVIDTALRARMLAEKITGGQTFHSFRHTFVSHLRGAIPEAKLIRIVGHTNTITTDRYTHTSEEDLEAVRVAVDGLLP